MEKKELFTKEEQIRHRDKFIEDCLQKTWGSTCHAEWIERGVLEMEATIDSLQKQHEEQTAELKRLENSLDADTVDNQERRSAVTAQCNALVNQAKVLTAEAKQARGLLESMRHNAKASLSLSAFAAEWVFPEGEEPEKVEAELEKTV
jgi:seryl-tRNA synthetase